MAELVDFFFAMVEGEDRHLAVIMRVSGFFGQETDIDAALNRCLQTSVGLHSPRLERHLDNRTE